VASEPDDRYFVTIRCDSPEELARIRDLGLDLFGTTATPQEKGVTIDGLLSLGDVGRVVSEGAEVVVHEHVSARTRAHEQTSDVSEWLADIGA
jgi:hypothetical protein